MCVKFFHQNFKELCLFTNYLPWFKNWHFTCRLLLLLPLPSVIPTLKKFKTKQKEKHLKLLSFSHLVLLTHSVFKTKQKEKHLKLLSFSHLVLLTHSVLLSMNRLLESGGDGWWLDWELPIIHCWEAYHDGCQNIQGRWNWTQLHWWPKEEHQVMANICLYVGWRGKVMGLS